MNINFRDRVVVITGAAHGLGREMSLAFAARGAIVWACDILMDELQETQKLCESYDGICYVRRVDVRNRENIFRFINEIINVDGGVDILVNNAGGVQGQVGKPLEEVSTEEWDSIYEVNTRSAFYFAQAVAPTMKEQRFGRIINISSGAGLGISLTGIQAYASAKAAQIGLTRQLAHELGAWQITVNNIAPGFVLSNPTTQAQWDSYGEEGQQALVGTIALGHLGAPEDIAHAVMFFASDYAGWITGQVLSVDGGR